MVYILKDLTESDEFLALQAKVQKARGGLEVRLLAPVELEAVAFLTYDLREFMLKPTALLQPLRRLRFRQSLRWP
jgi:hypothetical protein